ncbi:MAG: hypothetical protein OER88_08900 [Planctomycetota bacterium]|nr:hypothetical protein [Planctomycetota bacterium]
MTLAVPGIAAVFMITTAACSSIDVEVRPTDAPVTEPTRPEDVAVHSVPDEPKREFEVVAHLIYTARNARWSSVEAALFRAAALRGADAIIYRGGDAILYGPFFARTEETTGFVDAIRFR